jgi:hypothetical protein
MDVFVVIGLKDFSVTGHKGVGQVAKRVGRHRNTVSDVMRSEEWITNKRVVVGDCLVVLVSIEKMRDRGSSR